MLGTVLGTALATAGWGQCSSREFGPGTVLPKTGRGTRGVRARKGLDDALEPGEREEGGEQDDKSGKAREEGPDLGFFLHEV